MLMRIQKPKYHFNGRRRPYPNALQIQFTHSTHNQIAMRTGLSETRFHIERITECHATATTTTPTPATATATGSSDAPSGCPQLSEFPHSVSVSENHIATQPHIDSVVSPHQHFHKRFKLQT